MFASQEAERSIVGSLINQSKDNLIAQLKTYFGINKESLTVAEHLDQKMNGIRPKTNEDEFQIVEIVN